MFRALRLGGIPEGLAEEVGLHEVLDLPTRTEVQRGGVPTVDEPELA